MMHLTFSAVSWRHHGRCGGRGSHPLLPLVCNSYTFMIGFIHHSVHESLRTHESLYLHVTLVCRRSTEHDKSKIAPWNGMAGSCMADHGKALGKRSVVWLNAMHIITAQTLLSFHLGPGIIWYPAIMWLNCLCSQL